MNKKFHQKELEENEKEMLEKPKYKNLISQFGS